MSNTRPTCLNYGCDKLVTHSGARWRPFCAKCHNASYGKEEYAYGVLPFKTGYCSNYSDEFLGFPCPVNYKKAEWAIGKTEIDHIDGNYYNNTLKNCVELCKLCHQYKGMLSGDYKVQNKYGKAYRESLH
jgi:hypothetical protein